jgi:N-carbamoyl-D-amino-acid hydrolase
MRMIKVAAAQLGPVQKAETRQTVVARMLALLQQAAARGSDLIVYPELALTTFFPRWYHEDRAEADLWFEREMPSAATRPLFDEAKAAGIAVSLGYAELTPGGRHFNTSILVDKAGRPVGKYRKVHLPGHADWDPERTHQHLEKRYFEPGDLGFPVWRMAGGVIGMCICNDRRWPETYRVMGLQGVEMIVLAVAKAGIEDGHHLMGGTMIVDPNGEIVAEGRSEEDELVTHACDLDATVFGKSTIFDFARHRRIEHYGRITAQTGATPPKP